jgi:hypothetical protein
MEYCKIKRIFASCNWKCYFSDLEESHYLSIWPAQSLNQPYENENHLCLLKCLTRFNSLSSCRMPYQQLPTHHQCMRTGSLIIWRLNTTDISRKTARHTTQPAHSLCSRLASYKNTVKFVTTYGHVRML